MSLPMKPDDLTTLWLSSALSHRWSGTEVAAVRQTGEISGTATKLRLELDYADPASERPKTIYVKFGATDFQFANVAQMGLYETEVFAYTAMLSTSGPFGFAFVRPDCYFASFQTSPIQGVLLLEDLTDNDTKFNAAIEPFSIAQAAKALETLAELHGKSWESPALRSVQPVLAPVMKLYSHEVSIGAKLFRNLRGHVVPFALRDQDRYSNAWTRYIELVRSGPTCLLHGDSHFGNSYIRADGKVGFVDWQLMSKGHWVQDVAYFIVSALDVPDRRRAEQDLLVHYLSELGKYGVTSPSFAEAWQQYKQAIIYSLVVWLGNPNNCQTPEINLTCLARTAFAMMDLETLEALGV
jgi:hypothetical protein